MLARLHAIGQKWIVAPRDASRFIGCRQGCRANPSSPRIQDDTPPRCTGSIVIQRG